jgi:gas vesicle protein
MVKKAGFLTGVILGALTGATVAFLTAPKEGKKLRREVKALYQDYQTDSKATLEDVRETVHQFYDDKSGQFVEFSTEKFNVIKEKFDTGEISVDKVKTFLIAKKDEIKTKIATGELSKDKVLELLNATKEKIADRVTELKETQDMDIDSNAFDLALDQEELLNQSETFSVDAKELAEKDV